MTEKPETLVCPICCGIHPTGHRDKELGEELANTKYWLEWNIQKKIEALVRVAEDEKTIFHLKNKFEAVKKKTIELMSRFTIGIIYTQNEEIKAKFRGYLNEIWEILEAEE